MNGYLFLLFWIDISPYLYWDRVELHFNWYQLIRDMNVYMNDTEVDKMYGFNVYAVCGMSIIFSACEYSEMLNQHFNTPFGTKFSTWKRSKAIDHKQRKRIGTYGSPSFPEHWAWMAHCYSVLILCTFFIEKAQN